MSDIPILTVTKFKSFSLFQLYQESSVKEIEQLKMDFAYAIQDKLLLEERLHKGQKGIKELQTVTKYLK